MAETPRQEEAPEGISPEELRRKESEQEWLNSQNPYDMFLLMHFGSGDISERKSMLLACRFCERIPHLSKADKKALEILESWAENRDNFNNKDRVLVHQSVRNPEVAYIFDRFISMGKFDQDGAQTVGVNSVVDSSWSLVGDSRSEKVQQEKLHQVEIIHDIVNNPFAKEQPKLDPSWLAWNDGTVPKMAQVMYDERNFTNMPLLADALEDAGCDNQEILMHCRGNCEHVRGCWVLDLLLQREEK